MFSMAHVDTHRNIDDYFYPASYPIGKVAMYEGTGVEMSSWVILGIVIIGCLQTAHQPAAGDDPGKRQGTCPGGFRRGETS